VLEPKQSCFESMVHAYAADLFRFAYWKCRDRALAEDLVQETYARAWAAWRDLRDEKAAKHWLFTILHREHARLYERKRVESDARVSESELESELESLMLAAETEARRSVELRDALWALPEPFREPLVLQVLGGFACGEIARMLGVSEAAVMQRVSRARRALRKQLEPERDLLERRS
jgi:RNA polymerase sigma-70 factor, ECF subfamily